MKHINLLRISALALSTALLIAVGPVAAHGSEGSSPHTQGSKRTIAAAETPEVHKDRSAENRHKKCESHKHGLATKFERTVTNSQRIQKRIDGIFDKALAYQQANNLNPANFEELVTEAQAAKAKSSESITNLETVKPTLDCNNVSVAQDVANFKTAAKDTRDNLKAYRKAVKAVLKSLQTVKTEAAEGGDQ